MMVTVVVCDAAGSIHTEDAHQDAAHGARCVVSV